VSIVSGEARDGVFLDEGTVFLSFSGPSGRSDHAGEARCQSDERGGEDEVGNASERNVMRSKHNRSESLREQVLTLQAV
jgi:hypothetical protein